MFRLKIDTDNAAFECHSPAHANPQACGQRAREVARILREVAHQLEKGEYFGRRSLFDVNGNRVGFASMGGE